MLNSVYLGLYALMAPVILYRRLFKGRSLGNFPQRALGWVPCRRPEDSHVVWLHAVSVGEVNLLQVLLDRLQDCYPSTRFVISTTTATGMRLARQKYSKHTVFYFPIDFSWAIGNAFRRLRPDLMILTELEVWPNLVALANRKRIPITVINGRLSQKSFDGYQKRLRFVQPTFAGLDLVVAQSSEYALRFEHLGCPKQRVSIAGSIKFDGATLAADAFQVEALQRIIGLQAAETLWVAGSTQGPEEEMVARIWRQLAQRFPRIRLVIVPRHPERGPAILKQLQGDGLQGRLQSTMSGKETVLPGQILISDTIGQLTAWWSLAKIAMVGGSFGSRGGQNMIEPAAAGAAVCFGPNTWNFSEIVRAMKDSGTARELSGDVDLQNFVKWCLQSPEEAKRMGARARQLVFDSQGAVEATCHRLSVFFPCQDAKDKPSKSVCRAA